MNFCLCTYTLALATIDILLLSQYCPTKSCLSPKYFLNGNVVMVLSQNIGRDSFNSTYRKIPKISPGTYIFQRPFLRSLFLERLIIVWAYVRREISVSKSIGLACSGKEIYHFCFVLLCIREEIPSTSRPRAYIRRVFCVTIWGGGGGYIWRSLYMEGLIFRILRYFNPTSLYTSLYYIP